MTLESRATFWSIQKEITIAPRKQTVQVLPGNLHSLVTEQLGKTMEEFREHAKNEGFSGTTLSRIANATRRTTTGVLQDLVKIIQDFDETMEFDEVVTLLTTATPPSVAIDFFGRREELEKLRLSICNENFSVIHVWGIGGIGKSRLVQEVLATLDQPEHSYFVALASIEDQVSMAAAVGKAIVGQGWFAVDPIRTMADVLKELPPSTIVLDNTEQLNGADVALVNSWTQLGLRHTFVITSVDRAHYLSEYTSIQLSSLRTLQSEDVNHKFNRIAVSGGTTSSESPAVQLFLHLARLTEPTEAELELVREVCQRLDGIPLAIKLTASEISTEQSLNALLRSLAFDLSVSTMLATSSKEGANADLCILKNMSLFASYLWNYRRLAEDERLTLSKLSCLPIDTTESLVLHVVNPSEVVARQLLRKLESRGLLTRRYGDGTDPIISVLQPTRDFAGHMIGIEKQTDFGDIIIRDNDKARANLQDQIAKRLRAFFLKRGVSKFESCHETEFGSKVVNNLNSLFFCLEKRGGAATLRDRLSLVAVTSEWLRSSVSATKLSATLEQLLDEYRSCHEKTQLNDVAGALFLELSYGLWTIGEKHRAIEVAEEGLSIEALPRKARYQLEFDLVRQHELVGNYEDADSVLKRASERHMELSENDLKLFAFRLSCAKAYIDDQRGRSRDALGETQNIVNRVPENLKTTREYAVALNRCGLIFWHQGLAKRAITEFRKAKEIFQNELKDKRWVAGTQTNMGLAGLDAYCFDNQPEEVNQLVPLFKNAGRLHKECFNRHWGDINRGGAAILDIARRTGIQRAAEQVLQAIQSLEDDHGDVETAAQFRLSLARYMRGINKRSSADTLITRAWKHHSSCGIARRRFANAVLLWESNFVKRRSANQSIPISYQDCPLTRMEMLSLLKSFASKTPESVFVARDTKLFRQLDNEAQSYDQV